MSKENRQFQLIGKAFLGGDLIDCAILIENEKIKGISKLEYQDVKAFRFSDQYLILPSAIDLHVHFRDWDQSYKENIRSASMAALAGGVTTALDMPNTIPPIDSVEMVKKRWEDFKRKSLVDFGIHSKPLKTHEFDIARKYIVGFKFYEEDLTILPNFIENTKKDKLVFHAQFGQDEISAVEYVLRYTEGCENVRFAHISRAKSIRLIQETRKRGRNIFIEVTPHHVFLSKKDLENKPKGYLSVRPPLGEREDNIAIIEGINNSVIDFIATDHAPHTLEEKNSENPPPGYPSLEIYVPLFLTFASKGLFNLNKVVNCMSKKPASYLGIKKGIIAPNYYADLIVVDKRTSFKIDPASFISSSKFSPFEGWELKFKVVMTILRGEIMFVNGDFYNKNFLAKEISELG